MNNLIQTSCWDVFQIFSKYYNTHEPSAATAVDKKAASATKHSCRKSKIFYCEIKISKQRSAVAELIQQEVLRNFKLCDWRLSYCRAPWEV